MPSNPWLVVHMVRGQAACDRLCDILADNGIMVRPRPVYKNIPAAENYFEIIVLKSEAAEARAVIMERGM